jgi:hypothetical protein
MSTHIQYSKLIVSTTSEYSEGPSTPEYSRHFLAWVRREYYPLSTSTRVSGRFTGWAFAIPPPTLVDYSCNEFLKDHSNEHGMVTIDTHFPNPISPDRGNLRNRSNLTFTDLLKPETETGQRWRSYLDLVAEGLNDLQQSDITVFYRSLHEMNGGWFWWGQQVQIVFSFIKCKKSKWWIYF